MRGLNLFRHHFKLLDQGCFRFRIGFEAFADLVIVRFGFLKNRPDDAKECVDTLYVSRGEGPTSIHCFAQTQVLLIVQ